MLSSNRGQRPSLKSSHEVEMFVVVIVVTGDVVGIFVEGVDGSVSVVVDIVVVLAKQGPRVATTNTASFRIDMATHITLLIVLY